MKPGEASQAGKVLILDHPIGGRRTVAHVFDLSDGGIAFLDGGWTDPLASNHTSHIVQAEFLKMQDGWAARLDGDDIFLKLHPENPPQEGGRARARREIEEALSIKIPSDIIQD